MRDKKFPSEIHQNDFHLVRYAVESTSSMTRDSNGEIGIHDVIRFYVLVLSRGKKDSQIDLCTVSMFSLKYT